MSTLQVPTQPYFTTQSPLSGGIAVDNQGNIYVTTLGNTVEKYVPGSGAETSQVFYTNPPNQNTLVLPYGIDIDNLGNLYVASCGNHAIVKITQSAIATTIYSGTLLTNPVFVLIDADGQLLVSDYNDNINGKIIKVYQCGIARTIVPPSPLLQSPNGLVRTRTGNLYIANAGGGNIMQMKFDDPSTLVPYNGTRGSIYNFTDAIPLSEAQISQPIWMSLDINGVMYFTENRSGWNETLQNGYQPGSVRKITGTGEQPIARGTVAVSGVGSVTSLLRVQEAIVNDGSIVEKKNIDLACDTWSTLPVGVTNFVEGQHYSTTGVPQGLILILKRISGTRIEISLIGKAQQHLKLNSDTIKISFLDAAVVSNKGAQLQGAPSRVFVQFNDPVTATYSDSTFVENIANDGSLPTIQTITLHNKEWAYPIGSVLTEGSGSDYTISNKPSELSLAITILTSTVAQIQFNGNEVYPIVWTAKP